MFASIFTFIMYFKKSLGTCQSNINFIYFNYKMAKRIVLIVYRKTTYMMKNYTAFKLHFSFAMFVFKVVCIFCSMLIKLALLFLLQRKKIPLSSVYNKGIMIGYVISIHILSPFCYIRYYHMGSALHSKRKFERYDLV